MVHVSPKNADEIAKIIESQGTNITLGPAVRKRRVFWSRSVTHRVEI
jgi:hypothetical protein